jgi:predicted TIM-barrel fold metal-dependent hydrolase
MVVQIHDDSAADIARLLAGFPGATFVLANLDDSPEGVEERIGLAARFPNLYRDISGHSYQRMGVLELAVQQAGSERVLFVSDYTLSRSYILRMRLIEITEKLLLRLRTKLLFLLL